MKADEIARRLGVDRNDPSRLCEGIKYVLEELSYRGHVYVESEVLAEQSIKLLGCLRERYEEALFELLITRQAVSEKTPSEDRVYLESFFRCESEIAVRLVKLLQDPEPKIPTRDAQVMIREAEIRIGKVLEEKQREAVLAAVENPVMVLTGGPGTGKTTIISFIIDFFEALNKKVRLAAPTGRAAKRMSEATGKTATTIHRMLEVGFREEFGDNYYNRNEENPIAAEVIIVDEMSMIDIFLMRALLEAIKPGTIVIFVGDSDQLPSVGVGRVLWDLIESEVIRTVRLTEIFRQSKESAIITNAHRVNRGEPLELVKASDFFFMDRSHPMQVKNLVVELIAERLPKYFSVDPREIQVLSPIKKSAVGVFALNEALQEELNPPRGRGELRHQDRILREGDKIMQIKNNYEKEYIGTNGAESGKGVFNGDIGYIDLVDPRAKEFFVTWEDQRRSRYGYDEADNIEHAYAMTVHKSQGSEFEVVVIPILSLPPMMQSRNILYTALTRAKTAVVIVGSMFYIQRMIDNISVDRRNSALAEKLRKASGFLLQKEDARDE